MKTLKSQEPGAKQIILNKLGHEFILVKEARGLNPKKRSGESNRPINS